MMTIDIQKNFDEQTSEIGRRTTKHDLRTVKQFCEENTAFTQGAIRWLLFHRRTNGLDRAVVKVGRRVLIDTHAFFAWINEQNGRK